MLLFYDYDVKIDNKFYRPYVYNAAKGAFIPLEAYIAEPGL